MDIVKNFRELTQISDVINLYQYMLGKPTIYLHHAVNSLIKRYRTENYNDKNKMGSPNKSRWSQLPFH